MALYSGRSADGIPDVIKHGVNGLLVKPGDATAIANDIIALKRDPALRSHLIRDGLATLKNHAINSMAADYYRIYTEAANKRK